MASNTFYVKKGNAGATAPYNTWVKAAAELDDVIDYRTAGDDDTIYVAPGTYAAVSDISLENSDVVIEGFHGIPVLPKITFKDNSVGGDASTLEMRDVTVAGIVDTGSWYIAVKFERCTIPDGTYTTAAINLSDVNASASYIKNCLILGSSSGGIRINPILDNIEISNNTIVGCVGIGLYVNRNTGGVATIKNNIIEGCGTGLDCFTNNATGDFLNDYNCLYNNTSNFNSSGSVTITQGSNTINVDPLFKNTVTPDLTLQRTSPCIMTGNPSDTTLAAIQPAGGLGRVNMGRYGGTPDAAVIYWAVLLGYGSSYGNNYGSAKATNEEEKIIPHVDEAYFELQINRIPVCYINLRGTNAATCFTNTVPSGNAAADSIAHRFDGSVGQHEFELDGTRICYIDNSGGVFG